MYSTAIKTAIYHEISAFLEAYKTKNLQVLDERFGIYDEFLAEIYEMLDFVEDKSDLQLFPIEKMDEQVDGCKNLELFCEEDDFDPDDPEILVDCRLYLDKEAVAIIVGEYINDDTSPYFEFHYFDV